MADKPVSHNAALVEFPRDQWGMTSELRKAGLRAASSVRGNKEKYELFLATLRILAQHAKARVQSDADAIKAQAARIEARNNSAYQRVASHGAPLPAAPVEPAT